MSLELLIDSFAGGGGASTGIEMALGRSPDVAINHDAEALALHRANHPNTLHLINDIWGVVPDVVTRGRPVGLMWASPDCKHFSKAKGGALRDRNIRDLAWVVVRWAEEAKPRVIILENVEEFVTWGPVGEDGQPIREFAGVTFELWVKRLRKAGYRVQWRELRACDYGAPTIRKRLFIIARRDGQRIVWPQPTHGAPDSPGVRSGRLQPWRTAADIIDWSLPCPSIFDTSEEIMAKHGLRAVRPLADATMRRIARGIVRYVLQSPAPFIVKFQSGSTGSPIDAPLPTITANSFIKRPGGAAPLGIVVPVVTYAQQGGGNRSAADPLHTICASRKDQNGMIAASLIQTGYGEREGQAPRALDMGRPIGTQVAGAAKHAVVAAFLAQHNGGARNDGLSGRPADAPLSTLTALGTQQQVVAAHMVTLRGSDRSDAAVSDPLRTIATGGGHAGLISAFLTKYYRTNQDPRMDQPMHTDTTKNRFGLVTVEIDGATYAIADIGMRMLTPRERFRAQGFPDGYRIDEGVGPDGHPVRLTLSAQGRMCGNSVCPPIAAALVKANCADMASSASVREAMA